MGAVEQNLAHLHQETAALVEAELGPAPLRRMGPLHRLPDVRRRRDLDDSGPLEGGGIEHLELAATVKLARPVDGL